MGAEPNRRESRPTPGWRGRVAAHRPRVIRAGGAVRQRAPRLVAALRFAQPGAAWRRLRPAGSAGLARINPLHLWLAPLVVAITLASGLATLAQAFRWV
jgi:hypothetical protein